MTIVREGSSVHEAGGTVTTVDETETIQSGTTLSVLTIHTRQSLDVTETPTWDTAGANEDWSIVRDIGGAGAGDNSRCYVYGLLSPTAGTKIIDYTIDSTDILAHVLVNYSGTVTTSLGGAIKFVNEDLNNHPFSGNSGVHASGGTTGNTLFLCGTFSGFDGNPVSNNAGFSEIAEGDVPNSGVAIAYYVADDIGGAPSAVTITWSGGADQNVSGLFEIVPAAGGTTGRLIGQSNSNLIGQGSKLIGQRRGLVNKGKVIPMKRKIFLPTLAQTMHINERKAA